MVGDETIWLVCEVETHLLDDLFTYNYTKAGFDFLRPRPFYNKT